MKRSVPPPPIMAAIAAMLKPYGIDADKLLQEDSKTTKSNGKKYLSPRDIEEQFSLGRFSTYRLIRKGLVKSLKMSKARSGKILIDAASLQSYLDSKQYIPVPMTTIKTSESEKG